MRYEIQPVSFNTNFREFGGVFLNDNLVFVSTTMESDKNKFDKWNGLPYLNLYEVSLNEDNITEGKPKRLKGDDINTEFHKSSAIFTKDGKTMYFAGNNISNNKRKKEKGIQYLKIYRASLIDSVWTNIEELSINGDGYSTAHPALNPTEDKLYFVSDMPKTNGDTDIFSVAINQDGTLGDPINLGQDINTKGRESFPFITKDGGLYFSSDGHYGYGGLDVYYTKLEGNSSSGDLLNVGKPINSSYDDIAFIINDHKGYVSSNRLGGKGYDDIYSFIETEDIKNVTKRRIFGVVTDKATKLPLSNTTIVFLDKNNKEIANLQTDAKGYYQEELNNSTDAIYIKALKESTMKLLCLHKRKRTQETENIILNFQR